MVKATDIELFLRFKRRDSATFVAVHDRYFNSVYHFIRNIVSDEHVGYDIAAESFVRTISAVEKIKEWDHISQFWFRAAKNLAIDHLRKRKQEMLTHKELHFLSLAGDVHIDRERITAKYLAAMHGEIEQLPRQFRQVVRLVLQKKNTREISAIMGITPRTVVNYKNSAIKALRTRILSDSNDLIIISICLFLLSIGHTFKIK